MLGQDSPLAGAIATLRADPGFDNDAAAFLDIDAAEHFAYQTAQAQAHASGRITQDTAQIIYVALGEYGAPSNLNVVVTDQSNCLRCVVRNVDTSSGDDRWCQEVHQ